MFVAEVVARMMFLQLSLCTSQGVGTIDRDRIIGKAADLAEEYEGGGRVVEKIESFSGMPAKIEKYRHQFCYGIFVSGDFMRETVWKYT